MPCQSSCQNSNPSLGWDRERRSQVVQEIKAHFLAKGCGPATLDTTIANLFASSYSNLTYCFAVGSPGDKLRKLAMEEGRLSAKYVSWCVEMFAWASAFKEEGEEDVENRLRRLGFREKFPTPNPGLPPWDETFPTDVQARLIDESMKAQAGSHQAAAKAPQQSISPAPVAKQTEQRSHICRANSATRAPTPKPSVQAPVKPAKQPIVPPPSIGSVSQVTPATRSATPVTQAQATMQASRPPTAPSMHSNISRSTSPTAPVPAPASATGSRPYGDKNQAASDTRATTPMAQTQGPMQPLGPATGPRPGNWNTSPTTPAPHAITPMTPTQAPGPGTVPGPCNWSTSQFIPDTRSMTPMAPVQVPIQASGTSTAPGPRNWKISQVTPATRAMTPTIPAQAPSQASGPATASHPYSNTAPVTPASGATTPMTQAHAPIQASGPSTVPGPSNWSSQAIPATRAMAPVAPMVPMAPMAPAQTTPIQAPTSTPVPAPAPSPSKKRKAVVQSQIAQTVFTESANATKKPKLTQPEHEAEALARQKAQAVSAKVGNLVSLYSTLGRSWREIDQWTSVIDRILDEERGKLLNPRPRQNGILDRNGSGSGASSGR